MMRQCQDDEAATPALTRLSTLTSCSSSSSSDVVCAIEACGGEDRLSVERQLDDLDRQQEGGCSLKQGILDNKDQFDIAMGGHTSNVSECESLEPPPQPNDHQEASQDSALQLGCTRVTTKPSLAPAMSKEHPFVCPEQEESRSSQRLHASGDTTASGNAGSDQVSTMNQDIRSSVTGPQVVPKAFDETEQTATKGHLDERQTNDGNCTERADAALTGGSYKGCSVTGADLPLRRARSFTTPSSRLQESFQGDQNRRKSLPWATRTDGEVTSVKPLSKLPAPEDILQRESDDVISTGNRAPTLCSQEGEAAARRSEDISIARPRSFFSADGASQGSQAAGITEPELGYVAGDSESNAPAECPSNLKIDSKRSPEVMRCEPDSSGGVKSSVMAEIQRMRRRTSSMRKARASPFDTDVACDDGQGSRWTNSGSIVSTEDTEELLGSSPRVGGSMMQHRRVASSSSSCCSASDVEAEAERVRKRASCIRKARSSRDAASRSATPPRHRRFKPSPEEVTSSETTMESPVQVVVCRNVDLSAWDEDLIESNDNQSQEDVESTSARSGNVDQPSCLSEPPTSQATHVPSPNQPTAQGQSLGGVPAREDGSAVVRATSMGGSECGTSTVSDFSLPDSQASAKISTPVEEEEDAKVPAEQAEARDSILSSMPPSRRGRSDAPRAGYRSSARRSEDVAAIESLRKSLESTLSSPSRHRLSRRHSVASSVSSCASVVGDDDAYDGQASRGRQRSKSPPPSRSLTPKRRRRRRRRKNNIRDSEKSIDGMSMASEVDSAFSNDENDPPEEDEDWDYYEEGEVDVVATLTTLCGNRWKRDPYLEPTIIERAQQVGITELQVIHLQRLGLIGWAL